VRPKYETKRNLLNEEETLKIFCLNMQCTYSKIRKIDGYSPDASFWRAGERVAIGEVKIRTCRKDNYPTYLISKGKVDSLVDRWHPTPAFLIVRWKGSGIYWVRLNDDGRQRWDVLPGGRVDRGDEQDIEDCYHVPITEFTRLQLDGIR
jgi:hypothetical protein